MKILFIILICIILIPVLYILSIMPRLFHRPDYSVFYHQLFAHRGLHDIFPNTPENSMAAFKQAVAHGFGIEMDVHLTKDNIPVVFHDDSLLRICGINHDLRNYTYEELQQFYLCQTKERIPKLADVLQMVDGRVPLLIEYKVEKNASKLCSITNELLKKYKGLYCIESFHPSALFWYRKNRPDIVRGQLSSNFFAEKKSLPYFLLTHLIGNFYGSPDFIAYNCLYKNELTRRLCRKFFHTPSFAWTVKSSEQLKYCENDYDSFIFESFIPSKDNYCKIAS